ncbi:MAG: tRNA (adenosine(37)-N6)-dimethylallyltransferase MiaA, partial [Gammaproteobacteria bacterium]|nr:tRNA (adenosine(37)-N6)-dimethylallyltransferase MiaA [Gammaproteobacteria bacterium]
MFLMGPTSGGKTDLAIEVAQRLDIEIISVDSAMVYRGMDIGTAKPDSTTLEQFPHRLVNILDPLDGYSVQRF